MTGFRSGQEGSLPDAGQSRLLVSAYLHHDPKNQSHADHFEPVLVQRGMPVLTAEGQEVGRVAAVIVDSEDGLATHFLLGRLPHIAEYRLVSLDLIAHVAEDSLQLVIADQEIEDLPLWHTSS